MHPNNTSNGSAVVPLPADVPQAQVECIDLYQLQQGNQQESEKLFRACKTDGVFYLDISGVGQRPLEIVDDVYQLDKEFHELPLEDKMQYDADKLTNLKLNGYKPIGRNLGGLQGRKDGFETYVMPGDGLLGSHGQADFPRPPIVDRYMANLREFTHFIHEASDVVLESLSDSLQLPKEKRLWHFHNIDQPSPSILRLLKYHPQPVEERGIPHISHTDMGTITFLFTRQPGLQVLSSDEKWTWVAPRENCAIVNVGDMLAMLTSDVLRSCPHRVGPLPGQAMPVRYSFAYMVRAGSDTYLAPLQSTGVPKTKADEAETYFTCLAWLKKKYGVLRLDTYEKSEDWMLTGRKTEAAAV